MVSTIVSFNFSRFYFGFDSVKSMPSIVDCNRYSSPNASTMVLILGECVLSENLTGVEGLQRRISSRSNFWHLKTGSNSFQFLEL